MDLRSAIANISGKKVSETQLAAMMKVADRDADGVIDYREFADIVRKGRAAAVLQK